MAPSSRGRGSIGKAAALALASVVADPSQSTSSSPSQTETIPEAAPQTLPEVAYGKTLNVPDNFLGAGHTGKGWTIDEAVMEGGKPVIKLHRRIKETGQIEEHTIDIDTFKAAKAYKDVQGGMSKAGRAPLLKRSDLGRSLDPQGEIIPDRFDGASRSYRVLLPGSRQPQWVPEGLIRDFKEGKPGALQRLRATVGLDKPQDETPAQAITSAVAGAVLGKNLATRLGLRAQRQEQSVDRPSAPTTASTQTRQANRAAVLPEDRAAQEDQARQKTLRQRREEIEDEEDAHDPAPSRRTIRYQATNAEGASAQVTSQDSQDQASTRLETTGRPRLDSVSTEKKGTRLSVDETTIPSPSAETSDVSAAINRPKQAPSAQVSQTVGEESSSPSSPSVLRDEETKDDPVQATLERAARRKQRQRTSANSPTSSAGYSGVTYGASAPQPSPNDLGALAASVDASLPAEDVSIRQMRQLMQTQARERRLSLTSRGTSGDASTTPLGAGVSLSLSSAPSSRASVDTAQDTAGLAQGLASAVGGAAGQVVSKAVAGQVALQGARMAAQVVLSVAGQGRESALRQVKNVRQRLEAQVAEATGRVSLPSASSSVPTTSPIFSRETLATNTTSFQESTPLPQAGRVSIAQQDLSLLQKGLGAVKQTEDALNTLPPRSVVPTGFHAQISGLENLLQILPPTPPFDEDTTEIETAQGTISSGHVVIPPPSSPASFDRTTNSPVAASGVRVGSPPISRRRSPAGSTSEQRIGTFSPRPTLSPSLNSAVQLNKNQTRDRATDQGLGDTRTRMLNEDSSIPTDEPQAQPLSSGFSSTPLPNPEEAEDILQTVAQEAEETRRASEQANATQASLLGSQDVESHGSSGAEADGHISEQGNEHGLSPQQQLAAATYMQAAQSVSAARQEQASKDATNELRVNVSTQRDQQPGFIQRMTKFKLMSDLLEGCLDGFGFLEFLVESTIALVNDRYFRLSIIPSLKKPGAEERHERYFRYGIILLDILLFFFILIFTSVLVGIIMILLG